MEAIGLNPIRLDAIGIDPIRLNAIRLGVPGASSGSVRPYIDPEVLASLVAVCICDGKSNNDPDRAVIKNLVDPDNPFVISNAAYKLNSGFGKYEEDFTNWIKYPNVETDGFNIWVNSIFDSDWLLYRSVNTSGIKATKIRVTGIPQNGAILYHYIKNSDDVERTTLIIEKDGIYELPESFIIKGSTITVGFQLRTPKILDYTKIKIEQIPSFQGALVTDGVEDLITSTKTVQEMLGGSNEVTVVSMINIIIPNRLQLSYTNAFSINGVNAAPLRNEVRYTGKTGIYGYTYKNNVVSVINNILGDKNDYEAAITGEPQVDDRFEVTRTKFNSSVAWYWTFIAKRALTTDEINQVIAYYNLDKYVKPDIYYDVKKQGLSNNTPDTDWYLKDFSGNGRDMQLYNYGKTPESGINEEGGLQSDGVTDYGQFVGDLGLKDYTVAVDRAYPSLKGNGVPIISSINGNTVSPFLFEFADNTGVVRPYSFGATTVLSSMELNRKISYQSTYIYDGTTIIKGVQPNTGSGLTIGRFGIDTQYANIALWSLLLFPYSLSEFLLERQLKRYKLGTLYPDMVEFRPIVKSNVPYDKIVFHSSNIELEVGNYYTIGSQITIYIRLSSNPNDEIKKITLNGIPATFVAVSSDNVYQYRANLNSKSPQKIDITIDEYIRYEDIDLSAAYPFIPVLQGVSWGDKLKVGDTIIFSRWSNLLPDLYRRTGEMILNGKPIISNTPVTVEKVMKFEISRTYLKDNEPNCILAPQILRIPNSSYKILGYIPDISGHGNHLKINNSAYAGMSGANGYKYDWNTWRISKDGITSTITDSSIHITSLKKQHNPNQALFESSTVANTGDKSNFKVNITGLTSNIKCTFNNAGAIIKELVNGVNEISVDLVAGWYGFMITALDGSIIGDCNITIEQIGEYEGSFCLDGVEDFITIPNLSHGAKQVLMKVNWNKSGMMYDQRTGLNSSFAIYSLDVANYVAYNRFVRNGNTYIDGVLNQNVLCEELKGITHNIVCTNGESPSQSPIIGSNFEHKQDFSKMALFTFMSFDEISSEDEIKELNDIVGIEGNTDDLFNETNI